MLDRDRRRATATMLTDPRYYNIRWLELLHELKPQLEQLRSRPVSERVLITGGGGQLASDLEELLRRRTRSRVSHAELDITDDGGRRRARSTRSQPDVVFNCAAFHNVDVCEREDDRAWEVNVARGARPARAARRGARLVHLSTNYVFDGAASEPYGEDDLPAPAHRSTRSPSWPASTPRWPTRPTRSSSAPPGLYGLHGSASKGGNFVAAHARARAREQGALKMVADQRLQPTFTADLAARAASTAVERDADRRRCT